MAYEVIMVYHLHMPLYFLGIFAEYLYFVLMVLICYCHHQKDTFFYSAIVSLKFSIRVTFLM